MRVALACALALSVGEAVETNSGNVKTITAVCNEPEGRALGWYGVVGKSAAVDRSENLVGGHITIVWEANADTAIVSIQASRDPTTITKTGLRVFQSEEQVTFVVNYSGLTVWMYSLYPSAKKLVASSHSTGTVLDSGGALVKSFKANCAITVR